MSRLFLSYRRRAKRDSVLAGYLREELAASGYEVFIDVDMDVGTRWSQEIARQIDACDCLIVVLSAETIESEMVLAEVRLAHQRQARDGKPVILPVRVDYTGPLGYELGAYLDPLHYELWRGPADNAKVRDRLLAAAGAGEAKSVAAALAPIAEPPRVETAPQASVDRRAFLNPSGTMPPDDPFYISRDGDLAVERLAGEPGTTLVIKAPRQMGKSSLLIRHMKLGKEAGKKLAFIDLQGFAEPQLADYTRFLASFATTLLRRLGIPASDLPPLDSGQDVTELIENRVFAEVDAPILLALDETDRLLGRDWQTDFFAMLRIWHNNRWQEGWDHLDLALVIATEPYLLVASEHQSPFNVGEVVTLRPFDLAATEELNRRYGKPLRQSECLQLHELLSGHPYLTRVALQRLVTIRGISWLSFAEAADQDDGPFADHLKALLLRLNRAGLCECYA